MGLRALSILAAAVALAACDSSENPAIVAPQQNVDSTEPDVARGELLSFACQACHTLVAGGPNLLGPNLHGVFGRRAGTLVEFEYSPALRAADIVWTPETLDAWLADPVGFLPGTTMAFTGYQSARDRQDLIAYLVHVTK
jgi:cytochrome c